jgi:hypothetical protein
MKDFSLIYMADGRFNRSQQIDFGAKIFTPTGVQFLR